MPDRGIRHQALLGVKRLWRRHGDAVPWSAIQKGFRYEDEKIPFFSTFEGVYKPRQLQVGALSVRSTLASQYEDERVADDRVWYDYSPKPERNRWLRECQQYQLPLLYFLQVKPKPGVEYLVFAPVEVLEDDPSRQRFLLDLSPSGLVDGSTEIYEAQPVPETIHRVFERRYGTTETRTRLFQAHFRREVLGAYGRRCAMCRLGESPVLDGAHLVPDSEELGEPQVSNGLALCALHHRAFDRDLVGVNPDFEIRVFWERLERPDEEPTEVLTQFDGESLEVPEDPRHRPDHEMVSYRWEQAVEG